MKKSYFLLISIVLSTQLFASPVINISDRCSCFSKNNLPYDIDHCENVASPRLVGVFKDATGEDIYLEQPGETVDITVQDQSGNNMVGIRCPGPARVVSGGSAFHATPNLPLTIVYAVPVYLNKINNSNFYASDQLIAINERDFDLATCTYLPSRPLTPTNPS